MPSDDYSERDDDDSLEHHFHCKDYYTALDAVSGDRGLQGEPVKRAHRWLLHARAYLDGVTCVASLCFFSQM